MTPRSTVLAVATSAALAGLLFAINARREIAPVVAPPPSVSPIAITPVAVPLASSVAPSRPPPPGGAGPPLDGSTVATGAGPADASDPPDGGVAQAWCAELAADNAARFAKLSARPDADACLPVAPDVHCSAARGVSWGYRLVSVTTPQPHVDPGAAAEAENCVSTAHVQLVRIDARGAKAVGPPDALPFTPRTKEASLHLTLLTDYDGDGERELLRDHAELYDEAGGERTIEMLTYKEARLSPYAPAAGIDIRKVEDIDGDGRLDIVSAGPYARVTMHGAFGEYRIAPALFAWHSARNGTFSIDDPASIAFTKRLCPSRPDVTFAMDDLTNGDGDRVQDVICEALWGGGRAIDAAWAKVCNDFDAAENEFACQRWPKQVSKVKAPFLLK